jgi:hypothetical protein
LSSRNVALQQKVLPGGYVSLLLNKINILIVDMLILFTVYVPGYVAT